MKRFFGYVPRAQARASHQLRRRRGKPHGSTIQTCSTLRQCPQEICGCIAKLSTKAKIEKFEPSYVARQLWYAAKEIGVRIKKIGWYIEEYAVTMLLVRAKNELVQFWILYGPTRFVVNLPVQEMWAT